MHRDATTAAPLDRGQLVAIDAACDLFEAAWKRGESPSLSALLDQAPDPQKRVLFRELLGLELDYRAARGDVPDPADYQKRFPEWARVVAAAFADRSNNTRDAASTIHAQPEAQLAEFAAGELAWTFAVAGYEILGELGRGGMGVVYRARQAALAREVAIKVIRSRELATEPERVRFQNEAEAVASLDHPHIVPIYEIGRVKGTPYFSMKLVAGRSLDQLLPVHAADPERAARVAAKIARAIHHAHQRGLLHRDLKPANILIDHDGEPRVTDFGLAKRLDADLDLSIPGAIVGTPSYMSPEQVSGGSIPLTTATDVHGLGTILYAMLAGKAPFAGTTLVDTLDRVRESPPEPPRAINPKVDRDLETVCLKCLEKEPAARYPSALALAEDLERWLKGEPILARPVSRAVRLAKWCRRNKAPAALACLLVCSFLGGFAGVAWKWREAVAERRKSDAVNELLNQRLLALASPENDPLGKNLTVRELLDRASAQLGGWLEGQPDVEAAVRETLGGAYLALGQYDRAADHLTIAHRLNRENLGDRARATLRAANLLGVLLDRTGKSDQAVALLRQNLATARSALGPSDPVALEAAERLGQALFTKGDVQEAESVLKQNVADRRRVLARDHPDTLRSVYRYSRVLKKLGRLAEAEEFAAAYAHSVQCSRGANHPDVILALTNQAEIFQDQGNAAQARIFRERARAESERILGFSILDFRFWIQRLSRRGSDF